VSDDRQANPRVYHVLLLCLLMLFPLHALSRMLPAQGGILLAFGNGLTLLVCMVAMSRGRLRVLALLLGIPAMLTSFVEPSETTLYTRSSEVMSTAVYVFMIYVLARSVLSRQLLGTPAVSAALCVYLLLGFLWANLYELVLWMDPEAFHAGAHFVFPSGAEESAPMALDGAAAAIAGDGGAASAHPALEQVVTDYGRSIRFYFSFVTLTTLGYGDISPVSPIAMSLATLEAIVGQLFLVVGVAAVVTRTMAQRTT